MNPRWTAGSRLARLGAALLWLGLWLGLGGGAGACQPESPPPSDPEVREALGLDDETTIHQILLSGRGDRTRILPGHLEIRKGDVVQFRAMDGRVHLVRFPAGELAPELLAFLEASGQADPPPLVERNARLVLTFEDAPVGDYRFVVEGHGAPTAGTIRVADP